MIVKRKKAREIMLRIKIETTKNAISNVVSSAVNDMAGYWEDIGEDDGLPSKGQIKTTIQLMVALAASAGLRPSDFLDFSTMVKDSKSW